MKVLPLIFFTVLILVIVFFICIGGVRYTEIMTTPIERYTQTYLDKPRVNSPNKVVISLTSVPDRLSMTECVLKSLLNQSVRVDEIYFAIPYTSRKGIPYDIPDFLRECPFVTILRPSKDLGPATKVIPAVIKEKDPETTIIYVDDDQVYGYELVERLVHFSNQHPDEAICRIGCKVKKNSEGRYAFSDCIKNAMFTGIVPALRYVNVMFGTGGCLIKSKFLQNTEVMNYDNAPKEAVYVDDVWISGILNKRGIKCLKIPGFIGVKNLALSLSNGLGGISLVGTSNNSDHNNDIMLNYFSNNWLNV